MSQMMALPSPPPARKSMPWASCQPRSLGSVGRKLGRGNSLLTCMHHAVEVCICVGLASRDYRYETSYGIDGPGCM